MPFSKDVELIKKMRNEPAGDLKAPLNEKQIKLLHQISKLEQLMDDTVYALVEEVNNRETPVYQIETEGKSSTLQTEGETETIHNLTTNSISEEKLPTIPKEI